MPAIKQIKQKELIRFLRKLDFDGPYSGGKHQFMVKGDLRIRIPNPHKKDIGKNLLKMILFEGGQYFERNLGKALNHKLKLSEFISYFTLEAFSISTILSVESVQMQICVLQKSLPFPRIVYPIN